jgi:hypothetical protein
MATKPRALIQFRSDPRVTKIAPIMAMPEIALEPDIKGVCRVGGTLLMTSNPMKEANTNTTSAAIRGSVIPENPQIVYMSK